MRFDYGGLGFVQMERPRVLLGRGRFVEIGGTSPAVANDPDDCAEYQEANQLKRSWREQALHSGIDR